MRRAANLDSNHRDVVLALRAIGCCVQSLASVGMGVPDLLVGYHGINVLLEVKDGAKKPSERVLTRAESGWHSVWAGQVSVVETPEEAQLEVIRICVGPKANAGMLERVTGAPVR
jgi:hypothetical protein